MPFTCVPGVQFNHFVRDLAVNRKEHTRRELETWDRIKEQSSLEFSKEDRVLKGVEERLLSGWEEDTWWLNERKRQIVLDNWVIWSKDVFLGGLS